MSWTSFWSRQPAPDEGPPPGAVASLVEQSSDAYVCYAEDGRIRYANPRAVELFFDGRAPVGESLLKLIQGAPAVLREALLSEGDRLFTVELDGWPESYHLTRTAISWAGAPHTLLTVRRMTHQVSRRDTAVSRQLVRLISHEVNNSLSPIQSLANSVSKLIERGAEREKVERGLSTIAERARHLGSFIRSYAELARLPDPRPSRQPWARVLEPLAELHPGLVVKGDTERPAYYDPVQLEQVLVNLAKNAIEAGSPPEALEVEVEVRADGTSEVALRDGGTGFTEEARRQALLPLYSTKPSGSGLGLTLCREIIEGHGGSLGLSNGPSGGAVVRWVLPGPGAGPSPELSKSRLTLTRG